MNILLALIPISLLLLLLAIGAFLWAVKRGQFDDLDTPSLDILGDDERPLPPPEKIGPEKIGPEKIGPEKICPENDKPD